MSNKSTCVSTSRPFANARNCTKADLRLEIRGGTRRILKDYSRKNFIIRLYGRFTLQREAKAYRRLAGLSGIPRCYGFEGKETIILEYIPSKPLSKSVQEPRSAALFDKLDTLVSKIHSRGVAVTDLHRSNILVTNEQELFIVDFAHALFTDPPQRPGFWVRFFMELDRYAAARIRARSLNLEMPAPRGLFGLCYRAARLVKKMLRRLKSTLSFLNYLK